MDAFSRAVIPNPNVELKRLARKRINTERKEKGEALNVYGENDSTIMLPGK
jgi:hypothetical protein